MRTWLIAVGMLVAGAGLLAVAIPDLIHVGPAESILVIASLIALSAGAIGLSQMRKIDRLETDTPAVEEPDAVPVPGDDLDGRLRNATPPKRYVRDRRILRRRAYELAHDTLCIFDGYHPDDATEALADGSWTSDRDAAAFLGGEAVGRSMVDRLLWRVKGTYWVERQLRRTIEQVEAHIPGAEDPEGTSTERLFLPTVGNPFGGVETGPPSERLTHHWRGVSIVALVGIGVGILTEIGPLLLAGAVGIGFAAYSRMGSPPSTNLRIERTLEPSDPRPGEAVSVTLTIWNAGESLLPDLRIIDGVPPALSVLVGTPRSSGALRPGDSMELEYELEATAGTHDWRPVTVIARSLNGSYERSEELEAETTMTSRPTPRPLHSAVPLRAQAAMSVGELPTNQPGEGVEFQSVRDYRPGDRLSRIDWRRFARTKDLTTVEFREERAATVVVAVDARDEAYRSTSADSPHAVQRGVDAADRIVLSLLEAGHQVGVASIAPDPLWLAPSSDRSTQARARELLTTHPGLDATPPDQEFRPFEWVEWLRARIPGDAQVIIISPMCDELIVEAIVRVDARGHAVTVVSPDPTRTDTLGHRLAHLERRVRMAGVRRRGLHAIDWADDEPLDASLIRAHTGWST